MAINIDKYLDLFGVSLTGLVKSNPCVFGSYGIFTIIFGIHIENNRHALFMFLIYCHHHCIFISSREILTRIENIILGIVTSLSKDEAPVLALPNRSSWANVR